MKKSTIFLAAGATILAVTGFFATKASSKFSNPMYYYNNGYRFLSGPFFCNPIGTETTCLYQDFPVYTLNTSTGVYTFIKYDL